MVMDNPDLCPKFEATIGLLSKRWVGLIWEVLMAGPCRFSQIQARVPAMSDRMLALRLKDMECEGVVTRRVLTTVPVQVLYSLTPKGKAFAAVLEAIHQWSDQWTDTEEPSLIEPESAASSGLAPSKMGKHGG
jgi:DNA-binding HxlR family transcriptional regulator